MKGVSPLLATVILIAFTISIAFIIATWATGFVQQQTVQISSQMDCMGAMDASEPKFYAASGTARIYLSVSNLNRKINLTEIKISVYYDDASKNLENVATGVTLAPGDTKTILKELTATEKPAGVRVVASNCPSNARAFTSIDVVASMPTTTTTTTTSTTITTTIATTTTVPTTTTIVYPAGLVALWHLDGNFNDSAGGHNGACSGSNCPAVVDGKIGQAYQFDGADDYIFNNVNLIVVYPFTMSVWVKTTASADSAIISLGDKDVTNLYYEIDMTGGNASLVARAGGSPLIVDSTVKINDGIWHYITGTFISKTNRAIYVDGVYKTTSTISVEYYGYAVDNCGIGMRLRNNIPVVFFNGTIDEVVIWNRALTQTEVQQIYENQR